jgi:hypothetical protein
MKLLRWLLVLLLTAWVVGSAPVTARADDLSPVSITDGGIAPPPVDIERWWGAAGAVLCGGEMWLIRTNPAVGMNPWALGAGLAGCGLMALDMCT